MNELERHEAGVSPKSAGSAGSKPAASVKETVKQVDDAAQDTLKSVRKRAANVYDDAADAARQSYESVSRGAARFSRSAPRSPSQAGRIAARYVEENPIMVSVLGLAAGLIAGSLLPGTRRENQVFGRYADDVKDQGLRYARDLAEQGKHYVEETLQAGQSAADRG